MTDNRQMVVGKGFLNVVRSRAIEGVAAKGREFERGPQIFLGRCQEGAMQRPPAAIRQTDLHEAIACRLAHLGVKEAAFNRQHVDACGRSGGGFLLGLDVEHRDLLAALLHPAQVLDEGTVVIHGSFLFGSGGGKQPLQVL